KQQPMRELWAKTLLGKTIVIEFSGSETVLQVKGRVMEKLQQELPSTAQPSDCDLIYAGKSLQDDQVIADDVDTTKMHFRFSRKRMEERLAKPQRDRENRMAFMTGGHTRLGDESALQFLFKGEISDNKNLVPMLLDFADMAKGKDSVTRNVVPEKKPTTQKS